MERSVVIGGGIAGVQAATVLSKDRKVALITNEPCLPYYRMRIEEIIQGKNTEELYIHPQSWYDERGIEIIHANAERIDTEKKNIVLSDGNTVPYDTAVIATGSEARSFPIPGRDKNIYVLRKASDAEKLREALSTADSFAVIGGGLLGLELASSVAEHMKITVSVIETAPYILPRQLDEASASLLQAKLSEKGVSVVTAAKTVKADDEYLYLEDGRKIKAAVIAFSVGVNPGIGIAKASGIETDKGIIIDEYMKTSADSVYAAGDAVEYNGRLFGLAMHAREMGTAAADSILGNGKPYVPSEPSALLKVAGIDVISLGSVTGDAGVITDDGVKRTTLFVKDGIITGAVIINDKASMMKIKAMIGTRR